MWFSWCTKLHHISNNLPSAWRKISKPCALLFAPFSSIVVPSRTTEFIARLFPLRPNQILNPKATQLPSSPISSAVVSNSLSFLAAPTGNQGTSYSNIGAPHSSSFCSRSSADTIEHRWINIQKLLPASLRFHLAIWKPPDQFDSVASVFEARFIFKISNYLFHYRILIL